MKSITWWRPVALLVTVISLIAAAVRILNYANVMDSFYYTSAARSIVQSDFSLQEILRVGHRLAVGFPLLLAGAIELFGPFAPAWVNLFFALGFAVLLAYLLKTLFDNAPLEALALLSTFYVALSGYPTNAHFLLYALRAMPALFFIMLGLCLLAGESPDTLRPIRFLLAGLSLVAAMSMREPSALGFSGILLWMVFRRSVSKKADFANIVFFFVPLLCCALAWLFFMHRAGGTLNNQIAWWLHSLQEESSSGGLQGFRSNLHDMLRMLHDEISLPAYACLLTGLFMLRRRPDVLLTFVLPAILYWLFYSVTFAHRRYVLDGLMFIGPLFGCGLYHCMRWLDKPLRSLNLKATGIPHLLAFVSLTACLGFTIGSLNSGGRQHTRHDIIDFQQQMDALTDPGDSIFCEYACRYFRDVRNGFTDTKAGNLTNVVGMMKQGVMCYYFKPLNNECYHDAYFYGRLRAPYVTVENHLRNAARLVPVDDEKGALHEVHLRDARFGVYRVEPWTQKLIRQAIQVEPGRGAVIWLDLGAISSNCSQEVRWADSGGTNYSLASLHGRAGIQGVMIPPKLTSLHGPTLEVESDCGMPDTVLYAVAKTDESTSFKLDTDRALSTHSWIVAPKGYRRAWERYVSHFNYSAQWLMPTPAGSGAGAVEITFAMFKHRRQPGRATFHYAVNGIDVLNEDVDLNTEGEIRHTIRITDYVPGQDLPVSLRVESPEKLKDDFYVFEINYNVTGGSGAKASEL